MKTFNNPVPTEVQETLDLFTEQTVAPAESKSKVVRLLSSKEPEKSQAVKSSFRSCTQWDGNYYCQDEDWQWHFVA